MMAVDLCYNFQELLKLKNYKRFLIFQVEDSISQKKIMLISVIPIIHILL